MSYLVDNPWFITVIGGIIASLIAGIILVLLERKSSRYSGFNAEAFTTKKIDEIKRRNKSRLRKITVFVVIIVVTIIVGTIFIINNILLVDKTKLISLYEDIPGDYGSEVFIVKSYAYIVWHNSGEGGLKIIDICNKENPILLGGCSIPGYASEIFVEDNFAYITTFSTLEIIDINNKKEPTIIGSCKIPGNPIGVYVSGNYAYIAADPSKKDNSSLKIIDIANKLNPKVISSYDNFKYGAYKVYFKSNYIYLLSDLNGLFIIDASDINNLTLVGRFKDSNADYSYYNDIFIEGNYAYIVSEDGLKILEISDKDNPFLVGQYPRYGNSSYYDIHVKDDYAFIASEGSLLRIFDISKKNNPNEIESFRPPDNYDYGVNIYIEDDFAYIIDDDNDLNIIKYIINE